MFDTFSLYEEECVSGLEMKKRKPEQPKKLNIIAGTHLVYAQIMLIMA